MRWGIHIECFIFCFSWKKKKKIHVLFYWVYWLVLFYSISLNLSYSMSWEWNNFDDTYLDLFVVDEYYLAHVMLFVLLELVLKQQAPHQEWVSLALGFILLFTKVVWLLVMHILSPEIAIEVWISTFVLLHMW